VVEPVGKVEFPLQLGYLGRLAVMVVENLQGHHVIGARGVVRPVNRRGSAVAESPVDDVALEPVAGGQHFHSLGVVDACLPERGRRPVIWVLRYMSRSSRR